MAEAPWHAHIYYSADTRAEAAALRERFRERSGADGPILYVGAMSDRPVGPHPLPQYEIHFREPACAEVRALIAASGLTALVHPLTLDDLADHTSLGQWFGEPLELDVTALDPPGVNQGLERFGLGDF